MIELFVEFTDDIYYHGYAEHLAKDDPEKFNFELNEFLENYGLGYKILNNFIVGDFLFNQWFFHSRKQKNSFINLPLHKYYQ